MTQFVQDAISDQKRLNAYKMQLVNLLTMLQREEAALQRLADFQKYVSPSCRLDWLISVRFALMPNNIQNQPDEMLLAALLSGTLDAPYPTPTNTNPPSEALNSDDLHDFFIS